MYAIVTDITPNRATVVFAGHADEVVEVLDGAPEYEIEVPENHQIVVIERAVPQGTRVWHNEGWIEADRLRKDESTTDPSTFDSSIL